MKLPFALIIGKSLDDIANEVLKSDNLAERMRRNHFGGYMPYSRDDNLKKHHELLPLVETLTLEMRNTEAPLIDVHKYKEEFPNKAVSRDLWKDIFYPQAQIICSQDGFVTRVIEIVSGAPRAEIIAAYGLMFDSEREIYKSMAETFITSSLKSLAKISGICTIFENRWRWANKENRIKLLVHESEINEDTLRESRRRGTRIPDTSKPLYAETIRPVLEGLGYVLR